MRFIRFPHNRKFILLSSRCNFGQQNSSPASHRFFSPWPASYSSASARLAQSYFCLSRCPCGTFQFFFSLKFLWQDVRGRERERWGGRKGQPISPTTHGFGERARFARAVLQPAGWDGGALSRGEQIPLLTPAVLIYMRAFITCAGRATPPADEKHYFPHCIHLERFSCAVILP